MTDRLPAADWTSRADLAALVAALGNGNARYVGGAVRDTLAGLPVKDVDIATPLPPHDVIARLEPAGIRSVPTGIEHGTITAVLPGGPVEITTLRHDVSTDGRRATVAFASDWREDAARRDFTINALYADPASGEIFDWFGGRADLAARRVRFIGDARQRIREDHLRIMRYFRFLARFGSQPFDSDAEKSCGELAGTLSQLSRERVAMELLNLLALPDPAPTIAHMTALGVLAVILPEANPSALPALVAAESREAVAPDPLRRLAALLPDDPRMADQVAARLRLSTARRKRLVSAAARAGEPGDPRVLAYRLGREEAIDRLVLAGESVAPLTGWDAPRLPLKGGDVVARGIAAGPEVTRILNAVEERWIAEGFPNAARTRELLEQVLSS
ncbi:MAG: CCA tRNA nucleotidyltransferase [Sphingomonadales bacterium]|nr:CCA tRNA nucleotidyltransferase [Sphingomonadales bacterium]MBU3994051.1 CCA tRNA nucleotidyltransferase [Alphaproteobacteria bacterium]